MAYEEDVAVTKFVLFQILKLKEGDRSDGKKATSTCLSWHLTMCSLLLLHQPNSVFQFFS